MAGGSKNLRPMYAYCDIDRTERDEGVTRDRLSLVPFNCHRASPMSFTHTSGRWRLRTRSDACMCWRLCRSRRASLPSTSYSILSHTYTSSLSDHTHLVVKSLFLAHIHATQTSTYDTCAPESLHHVGSLTSFSADFFLFILLYLSIQPGT
jgi:hypothetical protein